MTKPKVFYNGRIYTMAGEYLIADSMVISGKIIIAIGCDLQHDRDFKHAEKIDLKGRTVLPGFVDAHTHFLFMAQSLENVKLDGLPSLEAALKKIKKHASGLKRNEWIIGEGFSVDRWKKYIQPDRHMLDKVSGGRPAAIFSKDQHQLWANSRALEIAGINAGTPEPRGGKIDRDKSGEPTGILREIPGYFPVVKKIASPSLAKTNRLYRKALELAYSKGVTGVHTMDGPEAFAFFAETSKKGKLGLRITHYPPPSLLPELKKRKVKFNWGDAYFRVGGIKIFSDGSLGSQTALCFNKYIGSKNNFGVEVTSTEEMIKLVKLSGKAGFPCAIHAIGDRAISNVLDAYEKTPKPPHKSRHRIEHLQLIRQSDIKRLKELNVIPSMQPSHCPSDIKLIERYWGNRGKNCYIFNTLLKKGIQPVFGSDTPIEPLDPIAGISDAVNRTAPGSTKPFYPNERINNYQAVFGFTAAPWIETGRSVELGYLLPGCFADFVILSGDIINIPGPKIKSVRVEGTYFDGKLVFKDSRLHF